MKQFTEVCRVRKQLSLIHVYPNTSFAVVCQKYREYYNQEWYLVLMQDWLKYHNSNDWNENGETDNWTGVSLNYYYSENLSPDSYVPQIWAEEALKRSIDKERKHVEEMEINLRSFQEYLSTLEECLDIIQKAKLVSQA